MSGASTILVVDDDIDILEQVSLMLELEGYRVVTAHSQAEAEEVLMTTLPDLAIFDLMMENMDSGFVLCHAVKKLYPKVPVIMLTAVTASTGLSFAPATDAAGSWIKADALLDKPVRPEQLKAQVHRLLQGG